MAIGVVEFSREGYKIRKDFAVSVQKVKKIIMGVFSTHFVPLISILAPKIMKE